ncbi:MAG TPA: hypothetical protein VIL33_01665 [Rhodothermia bacterium]
MGFLIRFLDPLGRTDDKAPEAYRFTPESRSWAVPLGLGAALLVVTLVLATAGDGEHLFSQRFYFSYLTAWVFCLTVSLGGLFFVLVQHLTRAHWSVAVRRIPELLMMNFPILAVLGIPVVLGMHDLYHWTHEELYVVGGAEYDPILAGKRGYLNTAFFIGRLVFYFAMWIYISSRLYRLSIEQDVDPNPRRNAQERQVSAWGLLVFALTAAFAGIDLVMTLDPHWFSTMFGVYFFSGSFFVALASVTLVALFLQRGGYLKNVITVEHYHDLGKFMFAFTVFWTYIAFSQYMLIWYGNLPEETVWFRHRMEGSWAMASWALLFGHFLIPFFLLMLRSAKRTRGMLYIMGFWFLMVHFLDLFWLAMPAQSHHFSVEMIDITAWLGMVFLFVGLIVLRAARHATVPYNDPNFKASLAFENA